MNRGYGLGLSARPPVAAILALAVRGQNPRGIRAAMHPRWTAPPTRPDCSVCFTNCHVLFTSHVLKALLFVAFRTNSAAIRLSKRLANATPRGSRCSRGFIHGLLAATLACGDGGTVPPPPDPPRPTTVTASPATAQITALSATVQVSAEVLDQNGNVMAGSAVSWSSSAITVATVNTAGLVTAAGNGTATITATAGSASGSATVTVAQQVAAVAVSPAGNTLVTEDTLRLAAEATDANGHPVTAAEFSWASGDTLVAVVDPSGLVTGVGAGMVEITATSSGVTGRAAVTVTIPVPTTVAVEPDSVTFSALGATVQVAAEVRDQIGRKMNGVAVSWLSGDTTVAAVDSAGLVTALGNGATMIAATAGEVSDTAFVTVMQLAGSVVVSPATGTVMVGDALLLVAGAYDENGHRVEEAAFSWSSSHSSVATVEGSGLVTGVAEGRATITAMAGQVSGTSEITVENPDRAALVAFYEATSGPGWTSSDGWLGSEPLRQWYGTEIDEEGRVIGLALSDNNVVGPIPREVGDLVRLRYLHLENNGLTGRLPPELARAGDLTSLRISGNDLAGPLPFSLSPSRSGSCITRTRNSACPTTTRSANGCAAFHPTKAREWCARRQRIVRSSRRCTMQPMDRTGRTTAVG